MTAPIIHREFSQHDPAWYAIKAGKWSGSNAATIMSGLDTSGLASLVQDVAWERVFGPVRKGFTSEAMQRGTDLEAEARRWYEQKTGNAIEEVGFVSHASLATVGWSPDGLRASDERRAIEIKSPLHKAWMACRKSGKVPAEYRWQTRWAMWTGQLTEMEFVIYHPDPGGLLIQCEVTDEEIAQMAERVDLLETRVAAWVEIIGNQHDRLREPAHPDSYLTDSTVTF